MLQFCDRNIFETLEECWVSLLQTLPEPKARRICIVHISLSKDNFERRFYSSKGFEMPFT